MSDATNEPPAPAEGELATSTTRRLAWAGVALATVASAAAAYLLSGYVRKTFGVEAYESVCAINPTFDCDRINTSAWGKIADIPVTVFAIPTYLAFALLSWWGGRATPSAVAAWRWLRLGAGLALGYGVLLLYVMVVIEQTICLFCLSMDLMALGLFAVASRAIQRHRHAGGWSIAPLATATGVGLAALGAIYLGYGAVRDRLVEGQRLHAERLQAAAVVARDATAAAQASGATAAAPSAGPTAVRKISDSLFEIPVHADDPSVGPADAAVQIIEYADFQCGYCKKLFYVMQNLKRRYAGKSVRFVFKHFPMNTLCNPHIKNNRHKWACNAALASECARRQGKFWHMHDLLFKNQHKLESDDLRYYAREAGLDADAYDACMRDPAPRDNLKRMIDEAGLGLGIAATPRTFLNGLMLSGALPEELLAGMIDKELAKVGAAAGAAAANAAAPVAAEVDGPMAQISMAGKTFWIDRYEASLDAQGRALSLPGVRPANLSWYDAAAACAKAGKRLCTSAEWVSACAGQDAVDNDGNGNYADDYVEGNQFPYADFHEPGHCHVDADRREGTPQGTGQAAACRTAAGVFDLAGNVEEWIDISEDSAQLAGGDHRSGDKASCVRAHRSYGPGHRAIGIGFRCCADAAVANASTVAREQLVPTSLVGQPIPPLRAVDLAGKPWTSEELRGKVSFVTFFASWCAPCKRELPELAQLQAAWAARGLQVVAVGVDTDEADARAFVAGLALDGLRVVLDPKSKVLGQFDVGNMPTGYLIDREGVIRYKSIGFGDTTRATLEQEIGKVVAPK